MNKRTSILIFSLLLVGAILSTGFNKTNKLPNEVSKENMILALNEVSVALDRFELTLKEGDIKKSRETYNKVREEYKKVEFLVAYLQPEFVNDRINGAPLPKLERKVPEIRVFDPKGIQAIDELVYSEEYNKEELNSLTSNLITDWKKISGYLKVVNLTDRHVFEAMRSGLIRHYTLGVTGFDTPGSVMAMKDAVYFMSSLLNSLEVYSNDISTADSKLYDELYTLTKSAIDYLTNHSNFDDFDRLTYLKEYIDPLYAGLLEAHLALNIETIYEVSNRKESVNYMATSLFASDFINPYYYTNLLPEQHSDDLQKLGRLLFFDPLLSSNGKRACASCHNPQKAFTDGNKKSLAFDFNGTVERNSPTLVNSVYADKFFYDLRVKKLEDQFEHVIVSDKEFHTEYDVIEEKLEASSEYVELFKDCFPKFKDPVFKYTISMALSSYVLSLQGLNSRFDKYVRGEGAELTASEKNGYNLFMGKAACGTCHFAPIFNGTVPPDYAESESEVLGVPESVNAESPILDSDPGRRANKVVHDRSDIYLHSFKTVTVRNVELTAPYMHNGAYETLEQVMDFYHGGGGASLGIDPPNQTLPTDSLDLTESDKTDIIAFLKTLTDTTNLTNVPSKLPQLEQMSSMNNRVIGGEY